MDTEALKELLPQEVGEERKGRMRMWMVSLVALVVLVVGITIATAVKGVRTRSASEVLRQQ